MGASSAVWSGVRLGHCRRFTRKDCVVCRHWWAAGGVCVPFVGAGGGGRQARNGGKAAHSMQKASRVRYCRLNPWLDVPSAELRGGGRLDGWPRLPRVVAALGRRWAARGPPQAGGRLLLSLFRFTVRPANAQHGPPSLVTCKRATWLKLTPTSFVPTLHAYTVRQRPSMPVR